MAQMLLDLSKLISDAAAHIDSVCKARNTTFPSLDEPFNPATETIRMDPEVMGSLATLTSSADQLIATAWVPALTLLSTTLSVRRRLGYEERSSHHNYTVPHFVRDPRRLRV